MNAPLCFSHASLLKGGSEGRSWDEISPSSVEAMDPDAVAKAFVEHYYRTFDSNRAALGGLYQDASMLSFEGDKVQGAAAIVAKLTSLPFQQCAHAITTVDCQPSGPAGGMLVFVSGSIQVGGESHVLKFSQMFQLMPTPQGSFYVLNDIFRLNYA
ncbi:nuclear transport factor 2B-like [Curcuma longa]|uniref:nuclear transport factor 2B-like n=1 Tax=Curcuma longa TaxID=136217 RepID=UPI003D9E69A2